MISLSLVDEAATSRSECLLSRHVIGVMVILLHDDIAEHPYGGGVNAFVGVGGANFILLLDERFLSPICGKGIAPNAIMPRESDHRDNMVSVLVISSFVSQNDAGDHGNFTDRTRGVHPCMSKASLAYEEGVRGRLRSLMGSTSRSSLNRAKAE